MIPRPQFFPPPLEPHNEVEETPTLKTRLPVHPSDSLSWHATFPTASDSALSSTYASLRPGQPLALRPSYPPIGVGPHSGWLVCTFSTSTSASHPELDLRSSILSRLTCSQPRPFLASDFTYDRYASCTILGKIQATPRPLLNNKFSEGGWTPVAQMCRKAHIGDRTYSSRSRARYLFSVPHMRESCSSLMFTCSGNPFLFETPPPRLYWPP
ncbi:hypothetical protein LXA43DRAFT_220624 [Ganoderma leucocontextum]|nr:hypothetical protein LXA43DRAFT_220624 [Ganoderma leucocontextum]